MLKKRIIGVVTVKNGWAVQSFGYRRYLPLGRPEHLVENLDRWGADEILVQVIDRSIEGLGPDFDLLARLGALGLKTPLIYSGGIRSMSDGVKLVQMGADRIIVDTLLHQDLPSVKELSEHLGAQALIAALPMSWQKDTLQWLNYRQSTSAPLSEALLKLIDSGIISEVLIIDWLNEGNRNSFEMELIERFPLSNIPLIAFGGVNEYSQMKSLLVKPNITAIAIGNFLSYRENAIQKYKEALVGMPLRGATYEATFSMLSNV
jgi:imidazole glycerol-phosphate synthase subunit HisF